MITKKAIAKRIKKTREAQGITQAQLAKKLGVSQSDVSKIESGSRDIGVVLLNKVARILDVDLMELIYGKGRS